MRALVMGMMAVLTVLLVSGCATGTVYRTPKEADHGFAEFYVVPSYDESVVYKDAFDVTVTDTDGGGKTTKLGKARGTAMDGLRLRVACAPGPHEFSLRPKSVEKDKAEQKASRCVVEISKDMVTPVRISILVHETDSMGKRAVGKLLLGPALRTAIMEGAGYDMAVDLLPPQPFYDLYTSSRGWKGVVTTIEAHNEVEGRMLKARVEKAKEGLDLQRKENLAVFRQRYERERSPAAPGGRLVRIAAMANDFSFTWSTLTFDE